MRLLNDKTSNSLYNLFLYKNELCTNYYQYDSPIYYDEYKKRYIRRMKINNKSKVAMENRLVNGIVLYMTVPN